jgi:cytochrome c556
MQRTLTAVAVAAMLFVATGAFNDASNVPVSQYASTDDLAKLIAEYGERVGEATVSADEFEAKGSRMVRDARTMVVLATALGLHDQDHALKAAAPAIAAAAKKTAESGDNLDNAKAAADELKKALAGETTSTEELSWEKTKSLGQLMKQVNFINTRLKRNVKKLDKFQEQCAQDATLLAVIGQATDADTHEVKDDAKLPDWHKYSAEMRDASAELAAKIKAGDAAGIEASMKRVADNCDACHHAFPHD